MLALILLYLRPDPNLFEQSSWKVYSVTQLDDDESLQVVYVKSIISVVSVQPHKHCLEDGYECFFVWEQLGLDMALLEGQEEHSPEDE